MLSYCLNPACDAAFRYLYDGRIFTAERLVTTTDGLNTERVIEHYWLCGACSRSMKIVIEKGVATVVPKRLDVVAQTRVKQRPFLVVEQRTRVS